MDRKLEAEIARLRAVNAELLALLTDIGEAINHGKIDKGSQQPGTWKTYRSLIRAAIAKGRKQNQPAG